MLNWIATWRRAHRRWQRVVGLLMAVVVFCTTYALILPALTLENSQGSDEALAYEEVAGYYYKRVDSVNELNTTDSFLLVFSNGERALYTDGSTFYTAGLDVKPVKGNTGYYTMNVFDSSNTPLNPTSKPTYHFQLYHPSTSVWAITDDSYYYTLTRYEVANAWRIYYTSSTYITDNGNSSTTSSGTSGGTANVCIYKYVGGTLLVQNDVAESSSIVGAVTKDTTKDPYDAYVDTSEAKTGTEELSQGDLLSNGTLSFASDRATSQIESIFGMVGSTLSTEAQYAAQSANNGRLATDKSVVYNADDYDAIDSYSDGDFSVTLSALGQEYVVSESETVQTPLDVVFILDVSSSMTKASSDTSTQSRWAASADAINSAMSYIQKANSDNRVGLVTFSNISEDVMPLGRYTIAGSTTSSSYLTYSSTTTYGYRSNGSSYSYMDVTFSTLQTNSNLYDESTGKKASCAAFHFYDVENGDYTQDDTGLWQATYTQSGIQQAYNMLNSADEKTVTYTLKDGSTVDVRRQPVIILLTDGDPTFATYDYMDPQSGPHYGCGYSYGIEGFYTILSANYFKNMTSIAYQRKAAFYTIGMGVKPTGNGNYSDTTSWFGGVDSAYTRTILNPTDENIAALSSKPSCYYNTSGTYRTYANNYLTRTNTALLNLLTHSGTYGPDYITNVNAQPMTLTESTGYAPGLGYTSGYLAGTDNPYLSTGYNYADGAYFGNLTASDLETIFKAIIDEATVDSKYAFLLKDGTDVEFTDPLGDGMEVKGTPVLRYYGVNYTSPATTTGTSNGNSYIKYTWIATATRQSSDAKANTTTVNLSTIEAIVTTDKTTGRQTVSWSIPATALPTYYPNLSETFYYEELPVRLIYRVGLKASEVASLEAATSVEDATYYTNFYNTSTKAAGTTVTFTPESTNPYYKNRSSTSTSKTANTSGTAATSFTESVSSAGVVTQTLGNNGKLVINKEKLLTLTVTKQWSNVTGESAAIQLYGVKGTTATLIGTVYLTSAGDWSHTWTNLAFTTYDDYYIRELPDSNYLAAYVDKDGASLTGQTFSVTSGSKTEELELYAAGSGTVTVTNSKFYALPGTGGPGTHLLTLAGLICIVISTGLMYKRKKGGEVR